jgi:hypothetical protein
VIDLYVYYQNDADGPWTHAPANDRDYVLVEIKPRYMTVLATSVRAAWGEKVTLEAKRNARYLGPLYFDWDSRNGDLQTVIAEINWFLDKLVRLGVNVKYIRLYCSGSRGFHAEIPPEAFMSTVPPEGIVALPAMYKEMMFALCTDSMDTNVYSGGRGRMWRVPNVRRENGKYKVSVTPEEVRTMTPERYEELISVPRPLPMWLAPEYCPALAEIYEDAAKRVAAHEGRRRGSARSASAPGRRAPQSEAADTAVQFIRDVAEAAIEKIGELLPRWFPDGTWDGGNFVAINPRRDDKNPGSFKIHEDGFWKDYACEDHKGGDLVALKRFVDCDTYSMLEAARRLAAEIGFPIPDTFDDSHSAPATGPTESTSVSGPAMVTSTPNSHTPVIVGALELLARDFPEIRWIVDGILPEGLSLLAGSPKMGKSWLVLECSIASASADTCLGGRKTMEGRVLYLALEDNHRRLKDRLTRLLEGGKRPLPEKLHFALEWPRLDQGGCRKLEEWLTQYPDTRLVVIDTLAKVRRKVPGNANLYAEDYAVGAELKQLSDKYRVAIVVVTHVRKTESQDPLEMVSGTLGLVGGMDGILVLKRVRGQDTASLFVTGRDVPDEQDWGLTWNKDTCRWTIQGRASEVMASDARQKILALLARERRPLSAREIANLLGRKDDATRRLLPDMVGDGLLHQSREGVRMLYVHPKHAGTSRGANTPSH